MSKNRKSWDIAVTGLSVRTAGADNKNEFWDNIMNSRDSIKEISDVRMEDAGGFLEFSYGLKPDNDPERNRKRFLKCGYLEEIDKFDYRFFRISPKEASLMDPNQRLFLETVYEALEDAGAAGEALKKYRTGVYTGFSDDARINYFQMLHQIDPSLLPQSVAGNLSSIVPGRVSYFLNMEGPSILVDTACSSSLVAVHMACQGIITGDCEQAVAGGVRINLIPAAYKDKVGIESADGRTKTFDDNSDGTGIGEGSAAIVLKPLKKALKDRDHIYCVIKGSAINQDGHSAGITAPKAEAQKRVILESWKKTSTDPESLSFIEIHGTGTRIGDPAEMRGLKAAFDEHTDMKQFCAAGSVKTNTGHLFEAAGILSLIKSSLALKNRIYPPSINMICPNRNIPFEESALYVNDEPVEFSDEEILKCGVTAFGFSGTNCHMVLEEYRRKEQDFENRKRDFCFTLSARTTSALSSHIEQFSQYLEKEKHLRIEDICFTLNTGREHFNNRLAVICSDTDQLRRSLDSLTGRDKSEYSSIENVYYRSEADKSRLKGTATLSPLLQRNLKAWLKGSKVNWTSFYKDTDVKRTPLPTYPFERKRCWIDIPETTEGGSLEGQLYYNMQWIEESGELPPADTDNSGLKLIFNGDNPTGQLLINRLRKEKSKTVLINNGNEYSTDKGNRYNLRNCEEDFRNLFTDIKTEDISEIFFLTSSIKDALSLENIESHNRKYLYFLAELGKSLQKFRPHDKIKITLISDYAYQVSGKESKLSPENTAVTGLGHAIEKECENIQVSCIDIDSSSTEDRILSTIISDKRYRLYALRNNSLFYEKFVPVASENLKEKKVSFKSKGTYIVTGGTGGIGLEVADFISRKADSPSIYLISRTALPDRSEWDDNCDDSKLAAKIKGIRRAEANGAHIEVISADISDYSSMKNTLETIRSENGSINGIFHGAGVEGEGLLVRKEEKKFTNVIKPKISGTIILDQLTREDKPDFMILFSSVATYLMNPGQTDYTAANAFLDTYSDLRNSSGFTTLAINWVTWKETGMAVNYNVNVDIIFKAIPTATAINAMDELMNRNINKALIGELNINSKLINLLKNARFDMDYRIRKVLDTRPDTSRQLQSDENRKRGNGANLTGRDNAKYSDSELLVARVWGEVLGFDELKTDDNFYELGGDSILATQVVNRINDEIENKLSLVEIFNYETIEELAEYIDKLLD